ncbi:hypothetical protein EDB92DRAFT_1797781 [Lactarius akahatsu]|uniref:Glycosyl transferase family 25 domain-containing protein n=1 Tax=Lactarius akahatsu TaxID=416441 RepID=A0AAD4QE20_9AGAM|nr:hypothetical protein EDB92DRAFT_1797781 [Lactarius akahatsu]
MLVSSTIFPRPALRALSLVRSGRPLLFWVIVTGTLFTVCITLRHISVWIEDYAPGADYWRSYWVDPSVRNPSYQQLSHVLAFKTYVISLPRRADRRAQMDLLKDVLHVNWTYMDAVEANTSAVTTILRQVYILRSQLESRLEYGNEHVQDDVTFPVFDWPRDIETVIHSRGPLRPLGADLWTLPPSHDSTDLATHASMERPHTSANMPSAKPVASVGPPPLACASGNNVSATFSSNLPLYRHLTAAKVACWYSHFQTIRDVANGEHEAVMVLEDDVDMEHDMDKRLQALWGALPRDWDVVYLGHCWSDESQFPPLRNISLRLPSGRMASSALHPASAPKCTHAYVLSRTGARRIVAHLRHPPFAYSRAIDQALSWLVLSRRLRAFSIVPPVVVQRKISGSDVMPGLGSAWRSRLYDGVLGGNEQT